MRRGGDKMVDACEKGTYFSVIVSRFADPTRYIDLGI